MDRYLEGQSAIVTGGMRGIGLAIAAHLQQRGARVSVWDYDVRQDAIEKRGFIPDQVIEVDVSQFDGVQKAFSETLRSFGTVDILVNNAGINGPIALSWDYPLEMWDRVIATDLSSVFYCSKVVIPHMKSRGYGRIINISSIAGKEGVPSIAPYSAAKGGVIALTKAIAKELALDGITVNAVAPAMVETDLMMQMTPEHIASMKAKIPMGRFLQMDEVGALVSWIAGPDCSFTTGFTFDVTGGRATY